MGFGEGTFFKKSLPREISFPRIQPEADGDGVVDGGHGGGIEVSHFFSEAALVDGTYLFEEDHGILLETDLIGVYVDVGGQFGFSEAAGDGCRDNGRAVLVADVVLHDEDRPDADSQNSSRERQVEEDVVSRYTVRFLRETVFTGMSCRWQKTVRLRFLEGESRETVAEELGCSPAVMRAVEYRLRRHIRKKLEKNGLN
jgi:hypothetical protein